MTVDEWIYSSLNAITSLSGRISPEIGDAESGKPYIVYQLIGEEPVVTHNQQNMAQRHWNYQISCFDTTAPKALALGILAKAALIDVPADGLQSVVPTGSNRSVNLETHDYGYSFDLSIWESFT